jgi:hypothetical protein
VLYSEGGRLVALVPRAVGPADTNTHSYLYAVTDRYVYTTAYGHLYPAAHVHTLSDSCCQSHGI